MKLLIWGVSNIGKTTIGKELSKKLNCKFYDVDDEIIDIYGSIDNFQEIFPNDYDRFDEKEELILLTLKIKISLWLFHQSFRHLWLINY